MRQELNKNGGKAHSRRTRAAFIYVEVEKREVWSKALPFGLGYWERSMRTLDTTSTPAPLLLEALPCASSTYGITSPRPCPPCLESTFQSDSNSFLRNRWKSVPRDTQKSRSSIPFLKSPLIQKLPFPFLPLSSIKSLLSQSRWAQIKK